MALLSVPTDFSTLGLALAAAAPGDTVRILSGYAVTETCLITADSLTIDGQTGFAGLTLALGPTVTTLTITGTTPFRVIDNGGSNIITSQAGNQRFVVSGGLDTVDMGNGGATDLDRLQVDWATTTGNVTNGVWSPGDLADNEAYGAFINSNGVDRVDFSNVEVFDIRTGSGNDNFSTARGNDTVASGTGSDTINGDSGNDRLGLTGDGTDSILGGTGTDTAVLDYAATAQNVTGTLAGVTAGTYGTLVMTDVERVEVMLGAGNDSFVGGSLNDSMSGNGGRDSLDGGAGGDTILGGAGNDQLSGAGGNDLLNGGFGGDRLSDGQGDDLLFGDDGNDTMTGSTGADTYDGGAGIDHLVLAGNRADWSFSGGAADFSGQALSLNSGQKTIRNTEFVQFNDVLIAVADLVNQWPLITSNGGGASGAVSLTEGSTAVTTVAATDPDAGAVLAYSIVGGADAARFAINATTGALTFITPPNFEAPTDAGGNNVYDVVVRVSDGSLFDTQALAVTVTNVNEAPVITSNGGGAAAAVNVSENTTAVTTVTATDPDAVATRTFSISGGADAARFVINSTTGALTFITPPNFEAPTDSGGNNVYDVVVRVSDGSLFDTQALAVTVTNSAQGVVIRGTSGNDTITTSSTVTGQPRVTDEADLISGLGGDDSLGGGAGNDTLEGGSGNDTLLGGVGADVLFGGLGIDTLAYLGSAGAVNIDLGTPAASGGAATGDAISDFENVFGTAGNDTIRGSSINNLLNGFDGSDGLDGASGDDTLLGGSGNDTVNGGSGADLLLGEEGNDIMIGAGGNDTIHGNAGADRFIFAGSFGQDTIIDFQRLVVGEVIDISALTAITNFADLVANHLTQAGSNSVITAGVNTITLAGILPSALRADDFLF